MNVTKEDVDKAKDAAVAAYGAAVAYDAPDAAFTAAWEKYVKLKREFENGKG